MRLAKRTSNLFRQRTTDSRASTSPAWTTSSRRPGGPHGRRAGHDDLRAPGRRDAAARPDAARSSRSCKTITLGGAVTGLGIESVVVPERACRTSRCARSRCSPAHGEVVVATPDGEHADLFRDLPQLLRHARLRAAASRSSSSPSSRSSGCATSGSTDLDALTAAIGEIMRTDAAYDGERGRLPRRHRVLGRRGLPHARPLGRLRRRTPQRLHRVSRSTTGRSSQRERRLPDRARLPVAVGHRLVLVLAGVRRAEPADPPALAEALAAQRRLLEDRPPREPLPRRGAARATPARHAATGAGRAGRRDPARRAPPTSCAGSSARCRSNRSGCARSSCAPGHSDFARADASTPWPLYPLRAGPALRQRRLLVDRRRSSRAAQDGDVNRRIEAEVDRARRPQVALLRRLLRRDRVLGALRRRRATARSRSVTTRTARLFDLYAKAVKRR